MTRLRAQIERVPPALLLVIGVGILLRAGIWVAVSPVTINNVDSVVYVGMADYGLFSDPVRPAGYSIFLDAAHAISDRVEWTMALQNLLGVASACLLYGTVRRIGAPVWAGVISAAVILLSLDQIYLEHTILAETLFTFLVVAVIYLSVRALDEPRRLAGGVSSRLLWIAGAGVLLGLSAWVRNAGAPLVPFLVIWLVFAIPGSWRVRAGRAALAGGAAAAVIVAYWAINEAKTGTFGFTEGQGRALYGRTAPFADCTKFDPPEGTEMLCQQVAADDRGSPDFYIWGSRSPASQVFGYPPAGDEELGEFARAAIIGQPLSYAEAVIRDTVPNFIPGTVGVGGSPYAYMALDRRDVYDADTYKVIFDYYEPEPHHYREFATVLGDAQKVLRIVPPLTLIALALALVGLWLGRGRQRAGVVLLLGISLLLLLIPAATLTYNARYAVPIAGPLVAAGLLGLWLGLERRRRPS